MAREMIAVDRVYLSQDLNLQPCNCSIQLLAKYSHNQYIGGQASDVLVDV